MTKKRSWKFWTSRTILILILLGLFWVINLIWFRPFNIKHFYDKVFVQLALESPELTTSMGIPVLYDRSKDELDDISERPGKLILKKETEFKRPGGQMEISKGKLSTCKT